MKKLLLILSVLLVSGALMAQGGKGKMTNRSFLALHGGPSFTLGDFGKTDPNNEKSGYAKTGFELGLNYGYEFSKHAGLTASAFYGRYNINKSDLRVQLPGTDVDHWQYYGISAGPMLKHIITDKIVADWYVMGGVANANTPKFTYENTSLIQEDWQVAAMFKGGFDVRFSTSKKVFLFTNFNYMFMQPEFKVKFPDGTPAERRHQRISTLNMTGGFGFKF